MKQFRLGGLVSDTFALMRVHGLRIYLEFLAAGILLTTVYAMSDPDAMRLRMTGAAPDGSAGLIELVILDPGNYLSSALYTCVMVSAFLRLWRAEGGLIGQSVALPSLRARLFMLLALQAVADITFTLGLLALMPLAALIAALTMALLPAVMIEGRAWDAMGRSFQIGRQRLWLYTMIWFAIILPWVLSIVIFDPASAAYASASDSEIWLASLRSEIVPPVFSALGLCLTTVVYRHWIEEEAGGSASDLSDIFR